MWKKASNGESLEPKYVSIDPSGVIVTKNHTFIPESEDVPAHWEYEEWQMSHDQYDVMIAEQADVDYLTMENEYLEEQAEIDRADIDYLLMITEEE